MKTTLRIFAVVAALLTILPTAARAQWNPTESATPTITMYANESMTLTLAASNPSGLYPFTLETPFKCVTTQWLGWNSLINSSVLWVSHTNSTVTITGAAPGTTQVSALYQVSDCFGNSTDISATVNVTVLAAPTYQLIDGDSQLQFYPTGPID